MPHNIFVGVSDLKMKNGARPRRRYVSPSARAAMPRPNEQEMVDAALEAARLADDRAQKLWTATPRGDLMDPEWVAFVERAGDAAAAASKLVANLEMAQARLLTINSAK